MKDRIERIRRELDCTNRDIAQVIGVSARGLSSYLRGHCKWPEWVLLRVAIIESYLGLDPVLKNTIVLRRLMPHAQMIAGETITRVRRLKRLTAMRRRAL